MHFFDVLFLMLPWLATAGFLTFQGTYVVIVKIQLFKCGKTFSIPIQQVVNMK